MSRSVKLDYDRLRNPGPVTVTLYQCYECATCTTNPPIDGVALCEQHQQENIV